MKHTPGPWKINKPRTEKFFNMGANLRVIEVSGKHFWVAQVLASKSPTNQGEANARLIAAAPDLLEACKGVMNMLDGEFPCHPMSEAVRAAIKKAEG